ncbi:MAG: serine/threonine protein kinase [Phycisphaerales bacterium]
MSPMDPERWAKLKAAFGAAIESGGTPAPDEFRDDPSLRADLEALLKEHSLAADQAGLSEWALPSSHALARLAQPEEEEACFRAGDRVGGYTIETLIGRGGMGEVYRAEQDHPRRAVALKVIRAGLTPGRGHQRLEIEAAVLGRLHHPGIAGIIEAGQVRVEHASGRFVSRPFFSMELVEGEPLPAHADRVGLDVRRRVELIRQICEAVEHAHQRGVVHRDLKPANILVDCEGRPRVLDFGVARLLDDDARMTQAGAVPGTPAYMSPEQASGERDAVDTRSDVYAIGVILFELLTGRLPYEVIGKPSFEVLCIVREQAPVRPSTLRKELRGDLETIMLAALAKDPSRRYASIGMLGEDLRRYLAGEPIGVRPPSTRYLMGLFTRRHWREIAAAGIALAGGLVVASWQYAKTRDAEQLAQQRLADVRRASSELVTGLSVKLWEFESVAAVRLYLADEAMRRLEALAVASGGDPETLWDLSIACHQLGMAAGHPGTPNTGDRETALRALGRALELREQVLATAPRNATYLRGVAKTASSLAMITAERPAAASLIARSSGAYEAAIAIDPDDLRGVHEYAYRLAVDGAQRAAAEEPYEECFVKAEALCRGIVKADPANTEWVCTLGTILSMHATAVRKTDMARALTMFHEAVGMLEGVLAVDPRNYTCVRHIARAKVTMATDLAARGRRFEALELARSAESLQRTFFEQNPTDSFVRLDLAVGLIHTAQLQEPSDPAEADSRAARLREVRALMLNGRSVEQLTPEEATRLRWAESLESGTP